MVLADIISQPQDNQERDSRVIYIYSASCLGTLKPAGGHPALIRTPPQVLSLFADDSRQTFCSLVSEGAIFTFNKNEKRFAVDDEDLLFFKAIGTARLLAKLLVEH